MESAATAGLRPPLAGDALRRATNGTVTLSASLKPGRTSDGGLRPVDVGPLARAQQLEQLGFLHISLQQPLELGFGSTIKLHS